VLCDDYALTRQTLQDLGHQRDRDAVFIRDFVGAARVFLTVHGQVLDGN
jgi:hypothetical protein